MGGNGNGNGKAKNPALEAERDIFKRDAHEALLRQVDLVSAGLAHTDAAKLAELRATVETVTADFVAQRKFHGSAEDIAHLRQEIMDELLGLGPLEDLMRDPTVSEIMVNGALNIYVERSGKLSLSEKHFRTSATCARSSSASSRRSGAASTNRRRWSTRASPTARASTRSSSLLQSTDRR